MGGFNRASTMLVTLAMAASCSGDGCSCVGAIPGGFPAEERVPNAVQVRVTQTGLAALEEDPAALVAGIVGTGGGLTFDIPPACGPDDSPAICCEPVDGPPIANCGPVAIDLAEQAGDAPRLELTPVQGSDRLDVVVRARVSTVNDLQIWLDTGFGVVNCGVALDTTASGPDDLLLSTNVRFVQDADMGTTKLEVGDVTIEQLDDGDVSLSGGFTCAIGDFFIGFFLDTLVSGVQDVVKEQITGAVCKACASGDVADCGSFATACDGSVCMKGNECIQELGIAGRLPAADLLSSLSPGSTGAVDLYLVAGGYSTSNTDGLALGLLGGAMGGSPESRCGPAAQPPADVTIPQSAFFQGNTRPDTGAAFDVGIGVHQHFLDLFSYGAYEGGFLCLSIGTNSIDLLNSDTLSILMPSLIDVLHGQTGQLVLGLRPQQPPTITLGPGTFTPDGDIDEALLDVVFENMEIDFFAMVDDQFIRVMTMHTDITLPIGLEATPDGEIQPILGDVDNAFTNISVTNSEALLETPTELANRLPAVLSVAVPFLGDALGSFALPELGGLQLVILENGITSVDDSTFLAIFAGFDLGTSAVARVDTEVEVVAVHNPDAAAYRAAKLDRAERPVVELLAADPTLEYQVRVNGGLWSPYKRGARMYLSRNQFWLVGRHTIDVRARRPGEVLSADRTPVTLAVDIGSPELLPPKPDPAHTPSTVVGFHGRAQGDGGCSCRVDDSGGALGGALVWLVGACLLGLRRRKAWRGLLVIAALAALSAACGGDAGGDDDGCPPGGCIDGEVEAGPTGRFNDIASDGSRLVVSGYEEGHGDLVLIDVGDGGELTTKFLDGVPDTAPTFDPKGYRNGIVEAGANVGAWTSVVLVDGNAHVAYQDIDAGQLRYGVENGDDFSAHVVDSGMGGVAGLYASLAFDANGVPAIAYMATGIDDGAGSRTSQLRIAVAGSAAPTAETDWTISVLDEAVIPCGGMCGTGSACIESSLRCEPVASDCGECNADTEACVAGACAAIVPAPVAYDIPEGTGLFADLGFLPDGRAVVAYYDRATGDLALQEGNGGGFDRVDLDADVGTDTGMWASMAIGSDGTVHVAYQDARGDRVLYTTYAAGAPGPIEVVDDGAREGDRNHNVGAGAALVLDGSGAPAVVYQDGMDASLLFARRDGGGVWVRGDLMTGANLFGFFNSAVLHGGLVYVSTYLYDRAVFPPGELSVTALP